VTGTPDAGEGGLLWTLEEISRLVSYSGEPTETLANIVHLIQGRFGTDVCSVYLLEPARTSLVLSATIGLAPEAIGQVRMQLHEGLVGLVAERLEPLVVTDATTHPRFKYFPDVSEDPYHSFLGVPIVDRGLLQGVLVVQTLEARAFHEDDIRMLSAAAGQVAPLVSDTRLEQRRRLESEVVQRAKTQLVQTLAGGIAHELNNKLMPVAGFAELLIDEAHRLGNARMEEYTRTIRDSVFEASRIIRQLLQLSKPEAAEHVPCDLREIVQQALTLVRLRLKEAGVPVVTQLPDTPVPVKADAAQIKQVLVNLVWNAIDAMRGGRDPQLTLRLSTGAGKATLSCIDRGAGIDPELQERIFDPFFTTKDSAQGTGLGLSVSLSIVRQHGGDLRVTSRPGEGAAFHVVLPLTTAAPGPAPAAPDTQGPRVLVVDDEDAVCAVVEAALSTHLHAEVDRARNGVDAMAALEREDYALVVCDVRMPHMNGEAFLKWLTVNRPHVLRRMIFMTGDGSDSSLNAHIRGIRRPLLQKPFTIDALLAAARHLLRDRSAEAPEGAGAPPN
jgi:signal transduction histidine kinase/ActR/RegA family two-component response regulator